MKLFVLGFSMVALAACGGDDSSSTDAQADTSTNDVTIDVGSDASVDAAADVVVVDSSADTSTGDADASSTCSGCVVISSGSGTEPHGLFVDATNVYWTNEGTGTVMQAKLDGTSPVTLATGQDHPIAVTVRAGNVYWGNYSATGTIMRTPIGGGAKTNLGQATALRNIIVGASFIWWTNEPDDLQRMPATGLPDGGSSILLTANPLVEGIAVDATSVYWANRQDGYVKKSDLDLTNETPLATGDIPYGIAVDATNIYWTESGTVANTGKVRKASRIDGSNATTLATTQASPQGIAIDATTVYWTNNAGGTINKVPIAGGPTTVIASLLGGPTEIAVDGTSVYWTEDSGNRVMKAPK